MTSRENELHSVLAMVSKEEQRPIKACYNIFSPRRVIAWLDEVAMVTQADVWVKKITELLPQSETLNENMINSKLSLRDLDEKMTSAR